MLEYIYQQLKIKKHLVIVVAEGAGEAARDAKALQQGVVRDASNNVKLPVINLNNLGYWIVLEKENS